MSEQRIVVFDIETIPDLDAGRLMLGTEASAPDSHVRRSLGEQYTKEGQNPDEAFIKVPLHKIVCLGAIYARREGRGTPWVIERAGVAHTGIRTESQLVSGFIDSLAGAPAPQLVGFNSSGFDLPVLRYRALSLGLNAFPIHRGNGRDYWYRFGRDHLDLCDILSGFGASSKPSLAELAALCGIPAKNDGIDGSQVEPMVAEGRIDEVAAYCETDVMSTFLLFLRYASMIGELDAEELQLSIERLKDFIQSKIDKRPHLAPFLESLLTTQS